MCVNKDELQLQITDKNAFYFHVVILMPYPNYTRNTVIPNRRFNERTRRRILLTT